MSSTNARSADRRWGARERVVFRALAASALILGVTGLMAMLPSRRLAGWLLLLHVWAGGVFAVALAAAAVTWADAHRLRKTSHDGFAAARRALFWLFLLLGFCQILTTALSMTSLFGQDGMVVVYQVHRWAAPVLAAVVAMYAWCMVVEKRRAASIARPDVVAPDSVGKE